MRKTALGGLALVAMSLTACDNNTGASAPSASPGTPPSVVASAPDNSQIKNNVREWHLEGGDKIMVPLTVDLERAQEKWQGDAPKTQVLTDSVVKDTKAAMDFRPIPDKAMQENWVPFLMAMKQAGIELQAGEYDKAASDLHKADLKYKAIYDRNQAIFAGK